MSLSQGESMRWGGVEGPGVAEGREDDEKGKDRNETPQFAMGEEPKLGKGFCFEARQKRMIIDDEYYFADLVFYNRILHCNVITRHF